MEVYNCFRLFTPTCFGIFKHKYGDNREIEDYKDLFRVGNVELNEFSASKSVEDMKTWMGVNECKSPSHLYIILHSRTLRLQQLPTVELIDLSSLNREGHQVSSLTLILLVRVAQLSIPGTLGGFLVQAFSEANDILHYIDKSINSSGFKNAKKTGLAKALWMGKDFTCLKSQRSLSNANAGTSQSQSDIERALAIIKKLKGGLPYSVDNLVRDELDVIVDFVICRTYTSIEDLYRYMEQMFADMLHVLFGQLPAAIFKSVIESPTEEYEERVRLALQCIGNIESLEAHINWSFPVGCNLTSLITKKDNDAAVRNELQLTKDDDDDDDPSTLNDMFSLNR
ncbi:hypothetical protein FRX31_013149 [Thalictrum thalictroides]|uniref:Uncharacterized protein n=1 Tax=Thalictrum thalictroides TaxID=46969 RepID=A0A7J6WJY4_THATH|nr:hypothetical protein FRX31_013149 [Thalictrum thalictroides]